MKFFKNAMFGLSVTGMLILASCAGEADTKTTATTDATTNKTETTKPVNVGKQNAEAAKQANAKATAGAVNWVSIEEVEKLAKTDKRKVMVDLYTSWCGWCKRMDKATFQNPEIAAYLNENFYAVKFNAEDKTTINFKGKDHNFVNSGRRGYNQLAHNFASGRMSYPTIAFLDENLERINSFPGFKQPVQFDPLLNYINGDHYKTKTLAQFTKGFNSKFPMPENARGAKPAIKVQKQ